MITYIKNLQSKTEDTRKQIVVLALVASMSLVVFVWVSSLNGLFVSKPKPEAVASSDVKPFKLFTNSLSDAFSNISASVGKISSIKKDAKDISNQKQIDLIPVEHPQNQ